MTVEAVVLSVTCHARRPPLGASPPAAAAASGAPPTAQPTGAPQRGPPSPAQLEWLPVSDVASDLYHTATADGTPPTRLAQIMWQVQLAGRTGMQQQQSDSSMGFCLPA